MLPPASTLAALDAVGVEYTLDVPLAKRTWWRVGGPAEVFVIAGRLRALQAVRRVCTETGCPLYVLGNGSNMLLSDTGIRGVVVQLAGELAACAAEGDPAVLTVGAGFKLTVLLARARKNGWTGIEAFTGIPGTLGGAVFMNAGASLGETKDSLIDALIVLANGDAVTLSHDDLAMSYRHTTLPEGAIIASARLQTTGGDVQASQDAIRAHLNRRKASQPLDMPSCGSTFRNPPGDAAGRLIDAAGLKGFTVGNAQVSTKHANFIVNLGGASATDIRRVIEHVQQAVYQHAGIPLVREVELAGDWSEYENKVS